jgi:hypothetical protein
VIENVRASTVEAFVNEAVSERVSLLCTDQWVGYKDRRAVSPRRRGPRQGPVPRRRDPHEHDWGFWSIFKRGVVGTFHKVGRKYMPLYVAELQFRYNNRADLSSDRPAVSSPEESAHLDSTSQVRS